MAEKKSHLPSRLNVLFFCVFLLFSILILRLGIVQIVQGEEYQEQLERTVNISAPIEAPRGIVYDRYGHPVVDNELVFTVTYTNPGHTSIAMLEVAESLAEIIDLDTSNIYEQELKDYWLMTREDEAEELVSVEEIQSEDLSNEEVHQLQLDRIHDEDLESLTEEELGIVAVWRELISGYRNLPHKVKRGIEYEDAAKIMENLDNFPGVDIIRDADRKYVYGGSLQSVFGRTGTIPREKLDYYLANGYDRTDIVGTSYLEQEYEHVLQGRDGRLENYMDRSGELLNHPDEILGRRGNDLILSVDMELQQRVEEIIKDEVDEVSNSFLGNEDAYVVMMEPHTGEVLSMAGYSSEFGAFGSAFEMGSVVKGATILAGLDTGVISPGTIIHDRPLSLPGAHIRSHEIMGQIDDLTALERSSNIYMAEIAMRLIGYTPSAGSNWGNFHEGYDTLRSYYEQFGLGVSTGIDLPNEFIGFNGGYGYPGNLMYFSFGQFDTYTPLQLVQYVSTIANGGYRIAPQIVTEIREPNNDRSELGNIISQIEPKVLNTIDVDDTYMERVQEGFRRVMNGSRGTARAYFANKPYEAAGKTGTAQVKVDGEDANNQTLVGYAPYDNPEVAFSVVVPGISRQESGVANRIGEGILDAYFELKEDGRQGPQDVGVEVVEPEESE
ncbi:peptidoglycan D,D-transpeptidase FtsI family protein [Texcoconibacillus texcoconensis]|uniref:serine-type D-Ala-D-Ala carboxypeptidase n=1 Tax=Texcoconibacillus texcoconensis TaxID=1095777 RepID=A0A840QRA2_9BACI|nr:penicillin-binding protein 2 [Texcoconibacillus texcoconensis]MBB5173894.1 cell division protein FtsI/penicillin-binding protein 2 [Texcoconibacillus texcoconensis]